MTQHGTRRCDSDLYSRRSGWSGGVRWNAWARLRMDCWAGGPPHPLRTAKMALPLRTPFSLPIISSNGTAASRQLPGGRPRWGQSVLAVVSDRPVGSMADCVPNISGPSPACIHSGGESPYLWPGRCSLEIHVLSPPVCLQHPLNHHDRPDCAPTRNTPGHRAHRGHHRRPPPR
jgi:hypothetical protein